MLQKSTILIVDDSPIMCRFLGLFLEKKFEVISYTNSVEALALIESGFEPDLVVTDLNMPTLTGIELIGSIRKVLPLVPVLVVSGVKESIERIKALHAGADDFLTKPFHPAELEVRVSKLIEKGVHQIQEPNRVRQLFASLMKSAAVL